ncbi:ABC transporter permease [Bacillus wiedmannii]|nr:ABC transporter permease [Bacillus wiedmannii]
MRYFFLYFAYMKTFLIKMMEYRIDFIIGTISIVVQQVILLSSITIIFNNINTVEGFSRGDFLFMYGISTLGSAICYTFFDGLWTIGGHYIKKGLLDRILLRPINPLFQIISERIKIEGIASIILGISILLISGKTYIDYDSLGEVILLIIFCVSSAFIFAGILLNVATLAFWIVDSLSLMQLVNNFAEYGRYPISIYPKFLAILLSTVLPFLFTSFFPSSYFIFKDEFQIISLLTPLVAIFIWMIGILFWNIGLKRYGSSGT